MNCPTCGHHILDERARQAKDRDRKRNRVALKKQIQNTKRLCQNRYCLGEALESGYCGRHEELLEDAS